MDSLKTWHVHLRHSHVHRVTRGRLDFDLLHYLRGQHNLSAYHHLILNVLRPHLASKSLPDLWQRLNLLCPHRVLKITRPPRALSLLYHHLQRQRKDVDVLEGLVIGLVQTQISEPLLCLHRIRTDPRLTNHLPQHRQGFVTFRTSSRVPR